ncbi:unnamed protein product [marine sediment metagenome]|uniref:Uncharacterized protein n=1 Tax=marine sediment metagenome TaxID=412755 RepID=X0XZ50_9ZZZZ
MKGRIRRWWYSYRLMETFRQIDRSIYLSEHGINISNAIFDKLNKRAEGFLTILRGRSDERIGTYGKG